MAINSDIRDQAYQFFIEEAPELLQAIEAGLLTLRQEHTTPKVHNLMRAAHSIKGGAASVSLDAIATLSHRLENIFKALYSETLEIDTDLESQLLQAYDCLRLPLTQQLTTGYFDTEQALALGEPIFAQLEERFADVLAQADSYIPSSSELGIDMTKSIFEVDVTEGLERLTAIVAHPQDYEIVGEVRAQAEVFAGFAELLNQPKFGAIANTTLAALDAHPDQALVIGQLALADFQLIREAVLAGNAAPDAPTPCAALVALTDSRGTPVPDLATIPAAESIAELEPSLEDKEDSFLWLEDVFGSAIATSEREIDELPAAANLSEDTQIADEDRELEETFSIAPYAVGDTVITSEVDTDTPDSSRIIDVEWVTNPTFVTEEAAEASPLLEEVFGSAVVTPETEAAEELQVSQLNEELKVESSNRQPTTFETLEVAVQHIEDIFESLPPLQAIPASSTAASKADSLVPAPAILNEQVRQSAELTPSRRNEVKQASTSSRQDEAVVTSNLSVRVDSERLGRMNNLVGELAINRNGLSLQNEQLQDSVRELLNRFSQVQNLVGDLRKVSDQMLVAPIKYSDGSGTRDWGPRSRKESPSNPSFFASKSFATPSSTDFDSLELDNYGALHSRLQELLEDMMQLEESVDDIVLFARATDQSLEQQRQMLTQLRDELMWARMLPLGEVLQRFPRMLRDLSTTYRKPVNLKLSGTGVLVDKAVLEKLYDPLLHLLRNAFDHGIESPQQRTQRGKPEQGQIEIRAYHRGSQTIIEVKDDGQGLNLERIRNQALEVGLLSAEQLATTPNNRLFELIFEPGFSTASQVSELSGRGVGLDVVRSQMRSLKGTITVNSSSGQGTSFTLRLPLTLTIAKLLVCFVGSSALAMPSDSIEEIVNPKAEQIKQNGSQRFLHWRGQLVPTYRLANLLNYACPLPETSVSKALISVPSPESWSPPMLILKQEQNFLALEIDRLVTEQELVIKPFGSAIAPPSCTYGCTILGDGSLIPVIDGAILSDQLLGQSTETTAITTGLGGQHMTPTGSQSTSAGNENSSASKTPTIIKTAKAPTVLVVDDAAALRRTLALTLERAGCRVLQARDGREAIDQLQESSNVRGVATAAPSVELVICDIEMPNMNGFEFLSYRRQDPELSKVPVIMLTSRSNDKHRWLAMQLGATAYFTKPYLEQDFLAAIKQIIGQSAAESLPVLQPTL